LYYLCENNIWIPYVCQSQDLHIVHNPQLNLIKTGFHHTQRASHSRDSTRRSFGVPEFLPFSRYLPRNFMRILMGNTISWLSSIASVLEFVAFWLTRHGGIYAFDARTIVNKLWQIVESSFMFVRWHQIIRIIYAVMGDVVKSFAVKSK